MGVDSIKHIVDVLNASATCISREANDEKSFLGAKLVTIFDETLAKCEAAVLSGAYCPHDPGCFSSGRISRYAF